MSPDAVLLRRFISFNEPAAPVAIPAILLIYWIYGDTVLLILAASIVPTFFLSVTRRGRPSRTSSPRG